MKFILKMTTNKNWQRELEPLFNFWFAGLSVIIYLLLHQIIGLKNEQLEWLTWFFCFIILLILFLLIATEKFKLNILFKSLFSIPFYIFLLSHWEFSYASILFLLASVLLWFGQMHWNRTMVIPWHSIWQVLYLL